MTEENQETINANIIRLAKAAFINLQTNLNNPWVPDQVDKMEFISSEKDEKEFKELINACRFFYKHDPIVSVVFNKIVDIGINDLVIPRNNLKSENEFRIISALKDELLEFAENMMLEYLISGLVVPEIKYTRANRSQLKELGIKKYETLLLPTSMWLRDPMTIKINSSMLGDTPSYFVEVPEKLRIFIQTEGTYPDGTKDQTLYQRLLIEYGSFVEQVRNGAKYVLLNNPLILRKRPLSNSPYPVPYLSSVLEPLKHKRNLRRMDYSIAARVIGAIQLFKLGSDEFPVIEGNEEQFNSIKEQIEWRNIGNRDVERIFQLFANHTLNIEWIYPPFEALLDEKKYNEVNADIILGMGFPRILMTGETQKSGTSNAEFAMMSPLETINNIRAKILNILNNIVDTIITENNMRGTTTLRFKSINLRNFTDMVTAFGKLYDTGNLSRGSFDEAFGFEIEDELNKRKDENALLKELDLPEFNSQPFTPQAQTPSGNNSTQNTQKTS